MMRSGYYIDDELRVVQDEIGYRELGMSRRVKVPSDTLQNHVNAVKEFKDNMEILLFKFGEEAARQEKDITRQIDHGEFFLKEFKNNEWDANPMFDRLRLMYTSQVDSLKRERRALRKEIILKRITFEEKLLDAKKELSPFDRFF